MSEKSTIRAGDDRSASYSPAAWTVFSLAAALILIGILGNAWRLS